ncbi:MAG: GIY-YIG nuclease family protein [Candidatus Acidiferrales bacterium]
MKPWFCYLARCKDGSFYSGIATDLEEREKEHNCGVGAVFTAKRRPVKIVWSEEFGSQHEARRREVEIKGWSRRKKSDLITGRREPTRR